MDWSLFFEILKSISIITASAVAIFGINAWRREIKWKRKYELAEETLSLLYEVRDIISIIRSPIGHINEGKSRRKDPSESKEDSDLFDQAYTPIERFENNKDAIFKLKSISYRFKALFGKESGQPFIDLIKLINKILHTAQILKRDWKKQRNSYLNEERFQRLEDKIRQNESIIWEGHDDETNDIIKEDLDRITKDFERICSSVIKAGTLK